LIAFLLGKFAPQFAWVIVTIDIHFLALFAAVFTNLGIAPIIIGAAAVSAPTVVADVGVVERINDDGGVAAAVIDTAASEV
jgi:hypothetical protein